MNAANIVIIIQNYVYAKKTITDENANVERSI